MANETSIFQSLYNTPRSMDGVNKPTYLGSKNELGRVGSHTFPTDLLADKNNQYGGNYVIFYINVHQDSKIVKSGENAIADAAYQSMRGDANTMQVSDKVRTSIAAVTGVGAGLTASKTIQSAVGIKNEAVNVAGNALIGGATGAAAATHFGGATKKYVQMKQAICLYLPTDLQIKYGVNWEEADLAGSAAIATGAEGLSEAISKGSKSLAGETAKSVGAYGAGLVSQIPGVGQFLAKTSGTTANPKKEQLFKNVDFRTFSFSYQFFPRNYSELEAVQNIIYQFKLHMHPEYKDSQNFLYIYPSEFDIAYYNNGRENTSIHRHTSCVLTDMSINYGPQGIVSTFENGAPTQININLTFKELAVLSKESIMDGF